MLQCGMQAADRTRRTPEISVKSLAVLHMCGQMWPINLCTIEDKRRVLRVVEVSREEVSVKPYTAHEIVCRALIKIP